MAKYEFTGKIEKIGEVIPIPTKNGTSFNKREVIIDGTTYDRFSGEPRENHVLFEFGGNKCGVIDGFKVGDMVTVSFVLQGVQYEDKNDHTQKNITKVVGYECKPFQSRQQGQTVAPPSNIPPVAGNGTTEAPSGGKEDDMPF